MPPGLWWTANWIWVVTIAATLGLIIYLVSYKQRGKRD